MFFQEIYNAVKDKLASDEALLPTFNGTFCTSRQALLAESRELTTLLSSKQVDLLFNKQDSKWLDCDITEAKTPELRLYLMSGLDVKEVDPESFARAFNAEFVQEQSDKWIITFYEFLSRHEALWKKAAGSWERDGVLRSKPIIRLEDNTHVLPYERNGKPAVYIAHKDPNVRQYFPKTVKSFIASDKKAKQFLSEMGISEPDNIAAILHAVLPRYMKGEVPEKENVRDLEWISKTFDACSGIRREELAEELRKVPFLYAVNAHSKIKEYKTPDDVHLGQKYTGSNDSELFFEGNKDIWFLDGRYERVENRETITKVLSQIGCRSEIHVDYRKPNFLDYVIICDYVGQHQRGLAGFDPDCDIEGLHHVLENINTARSRIIWEILKRFHKSIIGQVETSTRQTFLRPSKETKYSKMGKKLAEFAWLPSSADSIYHEPYNLTLSDLPEGFDIETAEAKDVSEKLRFKPPINEEFQAAIEKSPARVKEYFETFLSLPSDLQKQAIDQLNMLKSSMFTKELDNTHSEKTVNLPLSELRKELMNALSTKTPSLVSPEDRSWRGPTPEELDQMLGFFNDNLIEMSKHTKLPERVIKLTHEIITPKKEEVSLRAFLLEEYQGHCQICNTKLDLGSGKDPYFEACRLIETRRQLGEWSNQEFNVISLCPNCYALMKYGGRELEGILDTANFWMNGDAAPEEVEERNGDYFIAKIKVAGKETKIYYTPVHMAALASFLKMTNL